ncbi:acyl-CoA thioesterase [Angustibacter sp. McL0619]|uniref:acyl-CoA thioesterase n=1 Tax=Angustibacter sp. McL0619 TaxID=3415676 RepID=UPI003CF70070
MSERTTAQDARGDGAELLKGLLAVLDLEPQGLDEHGQDVFVGASQRQPHGRVFGGQVLGQTLVAAGRTVEPGRDVHSMHGYFLRAGDSNEPITFAVERLRDGRSFSARRVHAIQFGKPILSMIASFQDEAPGLDHQDSMPDVPGPDELPTTAQLLGHIDHPVARYWSQERPMDLRHVQPPVYWEADPERVARNAVWMRTPAAMPDDPVLHRAVLGYASDYTLLESVLRRHGVTWATRGLKAASLDHAMWWHRPVRVDEWLLYVQASPSASGARGLGIGRIFSQDGRLVASVAQEGMLRVPEELLG